MSSLSLWFLLSICNAQHGLQLYAQQEHVISPPLSVEVHPDATVALLADAILEASRIANITSNALSLKFGGQELRAQDALADLGIGTEAMVQFDIRTHALRVDFEVYLGKWITNHTEVKVPYGHPDLLGFISGHVKTKIAHTVADVSSALITLDKTPINWMFSHAVRKMSYSTLEGLVGYRQAFEKLYDGGCSLQAFEKLYEDQKSTALFVLPHGQFRGQFIEGYVLRSNPVPALSDCSIPRFDHKAPGRLWRFDVPRLLRGPTALVERADEGLHGLVRLLETDHPKRPQTSITLSLSEVLSIDVIDFPVDFNVIFTSTEQP